MDFHAPINCMGGSRGGTGSPESTPPGKSQNIVCLSNSGPDPLKNHKATKQAISVEGMRGKQMVHCMQNGAQLDQKYMLYKSYENFH